MNKQHKHPDDGNPAMSDAAEHAETGAEAERSGQGSAGGDLDSLRAQIGEKEKEIAELKDKYLRTLAETENARKRIRQQSEESVRIQRESILRDLLPIIDNLERALAAARDGTDPKTILDGVQMTVRALLDFLRAQGVTPLASVGQAFDPARHEAVDHVVSNAHPPDTGVDHFHRRYQLSELILRAARDRVPKENACGSD